MTTRCSSEFDPMASGSKRRDIMLRGGNSTGYCWMNQLAVYQALFSYKKSPSNAVFTDFDHRRSQIFRLSPLHHGGTVYPLWSTLIAIIRKTCITIGIF